MQYREHICSLNIKSRTTFLFFYIILNIFCFKKNDKIDGVWGHIYIYLSWKIQVSFNIFNHGFKADIQGLKSLKT